MSRLVYSSRRQGRVLRIFPDLIRARELLRDLVWKDLRAQYRYAVMGFMWAVIEPLMMTIVLTFVFTIILPLRRGDDAPFAVNLLCAYLFWKFFSDSLAGASRSLIDNRSLINKVNFPREVIPLASVGFCAVNLAIGLVIFLLVCLPFGIVPSAAYVWLPLVFAIQLAMVVGLALLLSCLNVQFRDVSYIVSVGLVFGFYATPIFYRIEDIRNATAGKGLGWAVDLMYINPMIGLVTNYRALMVSGTGPDYGLLVWPGLFAAAALAGGVVLFRKRSGTMADHL